MNEMFIIKDGELNNKGIFFQSLLFLVWIIFFYTLGARGQFLGSLVVLAIIMPLFWIWEATRIKLTIYEDHIEIQYTKYFIKRLLKLKKDQLNIIEGFEKPAIEIIGGVGMRDIFDGENKWQGLVGSSNGQTLVIIANGLRLVVSCRDAMKTAQMLRKIYNLESKVVQLPKKNNLNKNLEEKFDNSGAD